MGTLGSARSGVQAPVVLDLVGGQASYSTFGRSPDVLAGRFLDGQDRSFQKSFTVVAEVEGREPVVETEWVVVEGFRERASTFVSATTDEIPLLILHDPPGSNSMAFLEEGVTSCSRMSKLSITDENEGNVSDVEVGFKASIEVGLFVTVGVEGGVAFAENFTSTTGTETTTLLEPAIEICMNMTERFETLGDPLADPVGTSNDVFVGVALNLIFALADVVEADSLACTLTTSETLATDLDQADPFATTYVYSESHIERTLIPDLERLIELAGGGQEVEGELEGTLEMIKLQDALANWEGHLALSNSLTEAGLESDVENRTFSGGTEFLFSETMDTAETTFLESVNIYSTRDQAEGGVITIAGYDSRILGTSHFERQTITEREDTETTSRTVGYVLADRDPGDFFSVDIGTDPIYGTPVFETISGRSSNPHEDNTQMRDGPVISAHPPRPVRHRS